MTTLSRPGVTLTGGARHWQIFQRNGEGTADIPVEGMWSGGEDESSSVQVRIVDEATNRPVARGLDWQDAEMDRTEKRFSLRLRDVPRGGLYRIETRVRRTTGMDRRPLRGDCVHHIGVGDVFVIAGQSNASGTGKGAATDGPALGVHLFGNDEAWRLATHPVEDAADSLHPITITGIFHGHSPWLAFGKRYMAQAGNPVGLIPTALGGSAISQWIGDDGQPGGLFDNMADMVDKAGGSIAGVLWYQGESDAEPSRAERYRRRFVQLAERMRSHFGNPSLPIFTGQLNGLLDADRPYMESWCEIREIQRSLARELDGVRLVVTIDCALSDEVHNSAASNVAIGERFADAALEEVCGFSLGASYPDVRSIRREYGGRRILIEFDHLSGDWTQISRIRDFLVVDEEGIVPVAHVETDTDNRVHIELQRECGSGTMLHGLYGYAPVITLLDDGGRCLTPFSVEVPN